MEDNFGTEENQNFWFSAVMFATELLATATRAPKNPKKKGHQNGLLHLVIFGTHQLRKKSKVASCNVTQKIEETIFHLLLFATLPLAQCRK
jgi:hypothetical protein